MKSRSPFKVRWVCFPPVTQMIPSNFQRDVTQLIEESSQDLSVSRPLSRVPWAIPVGGANEGGD